MLCSPIAPIVVCCTPHCCVPHQLAGRPHYFTQLKPMHPPSAPLLAMQLPRAYGWMAASATRTSCSCRVRAPRTPHWRLLAEGSVSQSEDSLPRSRFSTSFCFRRRRSLRFGCCSDPHHESVGQRRSQLPKQASAASRMSPRCHPARVMRANLLSQRLRCHHP